MQIQPMPRCLFHGHIVAEMIASEFQNAYTFPVVLVGPKGQTSQEMDLQGQPTGRPGVTFLELDTGDAAGELTLTEATAAMLGLVPIPGSEETVHGVTGDAKAWRSTVTLQTVPGSPVMARLVGMDCVVVPGMTVDLLGATYMIQNGLALIVTGRDPADPAHPDGAQGNVKVALCVGIK